MNNSKSAPKHLTKEAKKIFKELCEEYMLDDIAGLRILRVALEAFDRAQVARAEIEKDGMTVKDKFGQIKPHPLLPIERDSRAAFLAGLKALNLDLEPLNSKPGRPRGR
jgi:P27 family predicted phage terminase small subunit